MAEGPWYCYILRNSSEQYTHLTYNGSTNNPHRRLRQHNQEIVGGARYTKAVKGGWEIYALLTGFPDHRNALSCEWRIKHTNGRPGKRPRQHLGMEGRVRGLNEVLKLEQWTKQCQMKNCEMNLTLYIAEDVLNFIELDKMPNNVSVQKGIPELKLLNKK